MNDYKNNAWAQHSCRDNKNCGFFKPPCARNSSYKKQNSFGKINSTKKGAQEKLFWSIARMSKRNSPISYSCHILIANCCFVFKKIMGVVLPEEPCMTQFIKYTRMRKCRETSFDGGSPWRASSKEDSSSTSASKTDQLVNFHGAHIKTIVIAAEAIISE